MNSYEIEVRDRRGITTYTASRMTTSDTAAVVRDSLTSAPECRQPGATITVTIR